jgi:hypothetical protein
MMDYGPEVRRQPLRQNYRVGDTFTVTVATVYDDHSGSLAGTARNVTTGTGFLGLDPERDTIGTCSATGTTASIVDTTNRTGETANKWQYTKVTLRDSDGQEYTSRVAGSGTGTLSVNGFPVVPVRGDTYVLHGEPLLTFTVAGMSGNNGTATCGPTDLTMYAGRRELHYLADWGTDAQWFEFTFDVLD